MAKSVVVAEIKFNNFPQIEDRLRRRASQVVRKTALDAQGIARMRSRVDTGNMKNGWQVEMEHDLLAYVFNAVHYVVYHEYGTSRMSAQPMAAPAAETVRPAFMAAMRQIVGQ